MKLTTTRFRLSVLTFGLLLLSAGCDFDAAQEAFDNLAIIIELDDIETVASGQIVDAKTGELISGTVTISFTGADAGSIVDMYSDPITSMEASGGLATFGIANDAIPSDSSPLEVTVFAERDGYLPNVATLTITEAGSENPFVIEMVRNSPSGVPEGVTMNTVSEGSTSGDGTVQSGVDASVVSGNGTQMNVDLTAGSVLRTADGTPLSGSLTTSVSVFQNDRAESLGSLPGGYTEDGEGNPLALAFGANITVRDDNGNEASQLTGTGKLSGGSITIVLPANSLNPTTGERLQAGENIVLCLWNRETRRWELVQLLEVSEDGDGNLTLTINNLRYFGYYAFLFDLPESVMCTVSGSLNVNTNGRSGWMYATLTTEGAAYRGWLYSRGDGSVSRDMNRLFRTYRALTPLRYTLTVRRGGELEIQQNVDICSGTTTVDFPPLTAAANVRLEAVPECADPGQEARVTNVPGAAIYYRRTGAPAGTWWSYAGRPQWDLSENNTYLERGYLDINGMVTGREYDFFTTYDGDRYEETGVLIPESPTRVEDGRDVTTFTVEADEICS